MKYDVVSAATLSGLVGAVNNTGPEWEPVGGFVVIPRRDRVEVISNDGETTFTPVFAQTMMKNSPEEQTTARS